MHKRNCRALPLDIRIVGTTDRTVSKVNRIAHGVNRINDVGLWEACVTVRIGSIVNRIAGIESWGACVGLRIADVAFWMINFKT